MGSFTLPALLGKIATTAMGPLDPWGLPKEACPQGFAQMIRTGLIRIGRQWLMRWFA